MKKLRNEKSGEMGVGTLIIFIALIVVAAVAATAMIGTTDEMREQADRTSAASMDAVSTKLVMIKAVANTDPSMEKVTSVDIYCKLAPGSRAIDLRDVTIMDSNVNLSCNCDSPITSVAGLYFGVDLISSSDLGECSLIMRDDDLAVFRIDRTSAPLAPGSSMLLKVVPGNGSTLDRTLRMPTDLDMEHTVI